MVSRAQSVLMKVVSRHELCGPFGVSGTVMEAFAKRLESEYLSENAYHNALHAADVTQGVYSLVTGAGLESVLHQLEFFAIVVAAAAHGVMP